MSYKKYYPGGWQSGESGGTPITPEALNHMESGIANSAPAGYGYGEVQAISFWDDADETKLEAHLDSFFLDESKLNKVYRFKLVDYPACGATGKGGIADIMCSDIVNGVPNDILVVFHGLANSWDAIKRKENGIWYPWEHVNPIMNTGVEYRTTERYEGKPVYAKHITTSISMEANTGVVDIEIPHGISDFGKLVRVNGKISGSTEYIIFPCFSGASKNTSIYKVTTTNIILRAIGEYWNRGLIFDVYYTKATD